MFRQLLRDAKERLRLFLSKMRCAGHGFCATDCGGRLIALTRLRDLSRAFSTGTGKGKQRP
jgi:hypothetical protein